MVEVNQLGKVNIAETGHEKAEAFEAEMLPICEETIPKKKIKISSDYQPFYDDKLDKLN